MAALGFAGSALVFFFKIGPFAWDGLLGFWLVLVSYCGWFLVMFYEVRKAIKRQGAEADGTTSK